MGRRKKQEDEEIHEINFDSEEEPLISPEEEEIELLEGDDESMYDPPEMSMGNDTEEEPLD